MTFGILSDRPGTSSYHNDILKGIEGYGRSAGIDVLTFSLGWIGSDDPTEKGREALFEILRGSACSGYILYTASVGTIIGCDALFAKLTSLTDRPIISLTVPREGFPSVVIDNGPGFTDLCRHLVGDHGYRDIVFVSGNKDNYDARVRLGILKETLAEAGVELGEDRIWYGDFSAQSGVDAVRHFLVERKLRPEAVVCANDYSAIGAWEEAKRLGLLLPWDMAITGFDNIEIGHHIEIPFTTVKQPFYQQGYVAARLLHESLLGYSIPAVTAIPSALVLRESCGCARRPSDERSAPAPDASSPGGAPSPGGAGSFLELHGRRLDEAFLRFVEGRPGDPLIRAWQAFVNEAQVAEMREDDILGFFDAKAADFNGRSLPEETRRHLLKNLLRMQRILTDYYKESEVFETVLKGGTLKTMIEGIENFTQWLIAAQDIRSQADQLRAVFASLEVKNAWLSLYSDPDRPFDKPMRSAFRMIDGALALPPPAEQEFPALQVIPAERADSSWRSLLVEALYEGNDQLGLLVFDNLMWDSYTNEMLRRRLCTALQAINITRHLSETNASLQKEIERRRASEAKLSELTEELKKLSIKDELTGLLNRRGFLTLGERQIKHYLREKSDYLVLFADMDGLKTINDTWGHQVGDDAIRTAARILEASCREADLVARLGGDEFTVLLGSAGPQHAALIRNRIEGAARELSDDCGAEYRVSLSLGFVAASEYPGADLRELMDYADRKLYAVKKEKRNRCP